MTRGIIKEMYKNEPSVREYHKNAERALLGGIVGLLGTGLSFAGLRKENS